VNSIHKKLSRYLSISISTLLIAILLATDISVDTWISGQFERAMISKVGLLETLVEEDEEGIEFDFAGEFMPEFEGKDNPEYYQLWLNGDLFERSDTLEFFNVNDLPRLSVKLNDYKFEDIVLPDGRAGKMVFTKFLPQIDSEDRESLGITREEFARNQKPMELAYALSTEDLNFVLWFVDIIFVATAILSVFAVRQIVKIVVLNSLKPIEEFSNRLSKVSLNSDDLDVSDNELPQELVPIAQGVNQFIRDNHSLYLREQRLTSDIAHELKTPIAELMSLSEVVLKFPHEKQLADGLANEVFEISSRLKNIVNSIMLLQKSSSHLDIEKTEVNLIELVTDVLNRENTQDRKVHFECDTSAISAITNEFALEAIVSNLINNAIFYSPSGTAIEIGLSTKTVETQTQIRISNTCENDYQDEDLRLFFEPLWQKDQSRTSTERFGLGLAIVKSYCDKLGATVSVALQQQQITFIVTLR